MEDLGHYDLPTRRPDDDGIRILQVTDNHLFPQAAVAWQASPKGKVASRFVDFTAEGFSGAPEREVAMMRMLLAETQPDLVVFTGDNVDGRPFGARYSAVPPVPVPADPFELFVDAFMRILQPLLSCTPPVPWTFCPGNHDDDQGPWSRAALLRVYSLPGCLTPCAASFDHTLTVSLVRGLYRRSRLRLWLFDYGANSKLTKVEPVHPAAIAGYESLSLSGSLAPSVTELAFFHVPLPEYACYRPLAGTQGLFDARTRVGVIPRPWCWLPRLARLVGRHQEVGCSLVNTGLFDALVRVGRVRATFCGHNHYNDYVTLRCGVYLCFGRVSGLSPPPSWEHDGGELPFEPGARVLHVDLDQAAASGASDASVGTRMRTWVVTESGRAECHLEMEPQQPGRRGALGEKVAERRWTLLLVVPLVVTAMAAGVFGRVRRS